MRGSSLVRLAAVAALLIESAACASAPPPVCTAPAASVAVTELYFGRNIPGGNEVSEPEWHRFLDETVTSRFPEGFTVLDGEGQYRMADGSIVRERSKVLVLIGVKGNVDARLDEVIADYKRRFRQESVLRRGGVACVSFR
ncbi:MAG TPA: DUF3574 domain-containing protein [Stellaceae bacterium]|nr:DUF3574 domain-containing protein [Stellaceae bacterium]